MVIEQTLCDGWTGRGPLGQLRKRQKIPFTPCDKNKVVTLALSFELKLSRKTVLRRHNQKSISLTIGSRFGAFKNTSLLGRGWKRTRFNFRSLEKTGNALITTSSVVAKSASHKTSHQRQQLNPPTWWKTTTLPLQSTGEERKEETKYSLGETDTVAACIRNVKTFNIGIMSRGHHV
jgi:hypothetical protein